MISNLKEAVGAVFAKFDVDINGTLEKSEITKLINQALKKHESRKISNKSRN